MRFAGARLPVRHQCAVEARHDRVDQRPANLLEDSLVVRFGGEDAVVSVDRLAASLVGDGDLVVFETACLHRKAAALTQRDVAEWPWAYKYLDPTPHTADGHAEVGRLNGWDRIVDGVCIGLLRWDVLNGCGRISLARLGCHCIVVCHTRRTSQRPA